MSNNFLKLLSYLRDKIQVPTGLAIIILRYRASSLKCLITTQTFYKHYLLLISENFKSYGNDPWVFFAENPESSRFFYNVYCNNIYMFSLRPATLKDVNSLDLKMFIEYVDARGENILEQLSKPRRFSNSVKNVAFRVVLISFSLKKHSILWFESFLK